MIVAKDVMTRTFHTLSPELPVTEAARLFKKAGEEEQRKIFGMVVTDSGGRLIGMMSMYDILLIVRPKHVHVWGVMEDIDISGLMDDVCARAKSIRVEDIMTTEVITVALDTPLMLVLDIMIKKHIRRVPVVENGKIEGIVYISDLFYYLVNRLAP
jgi:CBS domain-containing protein